jgi:phosphatidylglycerophosphate synthase
VLDLPVRRWIDPALNRAGAVLARCGLNASAITVAGFALGMAGCCAIAFQAYRLGLALLLSNRLADGLDGAVARRTRPTDVGGYLDSVLDTVFYSAVPLAFAIARPENALPAAFLVFSFAGTGGSFLAHAALAARRGSTAHEAQGKSFFYHRGLMEGTETILFFCLFCLLPDRFPLLAWVFGGLCVATTAIRLGIGLREFGERP